MFNRRIIVWAVAIVLSAFSFGAVSAQEASSAYIQINNSNISVTATERPQVVIQFGNRGQETVEDVGILCVALGELRLQQAFTYNAFASSSISPEAPSVALPNQAVSYPSAFSFLGLADEFTDLRPGQNFNVAFQLEIAQDDDAETNGGDVLCALVNGPAVAGAAVGLGLGAANLTDEAVINLVASVALDLTAVSVTVR